MAFSKHELDVIKSKLLISNEIQKKNKNNKKR